MSRTSTGRPPTRSRPEPAVRIGRGIGRRRRRHQQPSGLPWILPALVLCVGLIYYCIWYTGLISTWDWNGINPNPDRVGLENYARIAADPIFWGALRHTGVFLVVTFVVQTTLGLVFATLLHSRVKLAVVYKVIIFIPVVLAPAITAPVFRRIYAPDGQFNWLLEHIGLGALTQPWIGQEITALPVIMAVTVWQWTGLTFVLYFAAMSQIDPSVIEAARMDGAGNFGVLRHIIWPGVRGTTLAMAILSAIGALKTFDVPYLITVGGPNYATEFLGTYIYRKAISQSHVGYGAALSIILLVLALAMALILQVRGAERKSVS